MRRWAGRLTLVLLVIAGLGAAGWLALRRGDIPFQELEARYAGAESRYVDLPGGVRMHYRDQGPRDAPVLLLVHGFAASLHTWEPWVRELGDDYRIVSVDLPGFGLTRTPDGYQADVKAFGEALERFAEARGLERFTLVGSSMGGHTAWAYTLAHPERVDALVLVAAAGWPETDREQSEDPTVFKVLRHPVGRALLRDLDSSAMTEQGLKSAFVNDAQVTPAMVERYVALSRAPGHRDVMLDLMTGASDAAGATPEKLRAIRAPTLVMGGEQDELVPASHLRRFASAVPGARLVAYPDLGHLPQEEDPVRSAADLRRFLDAALPRRTAQAATASPG